MTYKKKEYNIFGLSHFSTFPFDRFVEFLETGHALNKHGSIFLGRYDDMKSVASSSTKLIISTDVHKF